MKLTRFVSNQAALSFPWGIVYREFMRDGSVWAVVPLNWIFRWARLLWFKLRAPKYKNVEEYINYYLGLAVKAVDDCKLEEGEGFYWSQENKAIHAFTKSHIKHNIMVLTFKGWDNDG